MNAEIKKATTGVFAGVVIVFVIVAFFGILMGVADPDGGWAPWRVGLLAGAIGAAVALLLGVIFAVMWLDEEADRKRRRY